MEFAEVALESGIAYDGDGRAQAGIGVDAGGYDCDGDTDLFVTNFQRELNVLYRNGKNRFFTYASSHARLGRPSLCSLGFGTAVSIWTTTAASMSRWRTRRLSARGHGIRLSPEGVDMAEKVALFGIRIVGVAHADLGDA